MEEDAASETPLIRAGAMMERTLWIWLLSSPVFAERSWVTFPSFFPKIWPMIFSPSASSASSIWLFISFLLVCWERAPRRESAPSWEEAFFVMYLSRRGMASIMSCFICLSDSPVLPETEPTEDCEVMTPNSNCNRFILSFLLSEKRCMMIQ